MPPAGFTFCAPEGGACNFSGERQAAFGGNGRYLTGTATDGFKCTVAEWGSDPVPGAAKACFLKPATTPAPAPAPKPAPAPAPTPTPAPKPPTSSKKPTVLLVDDDMGQGADVTTSLRDAVKANAASGGAFRWDVQSQGAVPLAEMKKYDIVLWLSGEQYENTITDIDQQNLQSYLAGGGNLIVSGQDIGYDIGSSNFYRSTLATQFVADSSGTTKFVSSGVLGNVAYTLNADGSAKNQVYPDVLADFNSGVVAASWGTSGATAGTLTAQSIGSDSNRARAQAKGAQPPIRAQSAGCRSSGAQ